MRIAVVGPTHPFKGGVAQHTTCLANRLAAEGHEVQIVSWRKQYPERLYPGVQTVAGEPEISTDVAVRRRLHWARPWTWALEGGWMRGADLVVVAHVSPVHVIPYLALTSFGVRGTTRLVVVCHNVLPHEPAPFERPMVRALLRRGRVIVTHSDEQATLAELMTTASVVSVTLPPFGPNAFRRRTSDSAQAVHRRLLFFGLVRPYKGLDVLLRALASGPDDVVLRVAGEFWGGEGQYEELCRDLGIEARVEFIPGYVSADHVPRLFSGVDALVLPYRTATGSQGALTAFEQGIPVIASDAGQAASVRDGVDGLIVPAGDVEAFARAIHELYSPGRLAEFRSNVVPPDETGMWDRYIAAVTGEH